MKVGAFLISLLLLFFTEYPFLIYKFFLSKAVESLQPPCCKKIQFSYSNLF